MNNIYSSDIQFLQNWVSDNTQPNVVAPRYNLDEALIMVCESKTRPELSNLVLLNYHPTAAFRNADKWLGIELVSRGLIIEKGTGKLISFPFIKFFNYSELSADFDIKNDDILSIDYKEDGSLGICFFYNDNWHVVTHGSMDSEQGKKATEILRNKNTELLDKNFTYMVEIIYPENRVVTDYGDMQDLIFLGKQSLSLETDISVTVERGIFAEKSHTGFNDKFLSTPSAVSGILDFCKNNTDYNFEGFVVTLKNGRKIKFKTDAYLAVHKVRFSINKEHVKNLMLSGSQLLLEFKEALPNEFFKEVDVIVDSINEYVIANLKVVNNTLKCIKESVSPFPNNASEIGQRCHSYVNNAPKHLQGTIWYGLKKNDDYQALYDSVLKTYEV
jgi:RNA ligase